MAVKAAHCPSRQVPALPLRVLLAALAATAALLGLSAPRASAPLPALQALIDATPSGGELRPLPGRYAGPAVIDRPLTLDGAGQVTLDGGGQGTVLTVRTSAATVRGLHVTASGPTHDGVDAGILVEGDDNRIEDNVLDEVLFGIHLKQANRNLVRGNRIASKHAEATLRGDGIRLWYSMDNRVEGNLLERVRDLTLANSPRNRVAGNTIRGSRYGMHVVFSGHGVIEGNVLDANATGIVLLYSEGVTVRGNRVLHALDGGGGGVALKASGQALVEGNEFVHCATGVLSDSPMNSDARVVLRGNRFAHNITGVVFYGEQGNHVVQGNRFERNLLHATVSMNGDPLKNDWRGNFWDDYEGFDRDGDGIGDRPHELLAFADRIWMEIPQARFFRNSPALELLDFLERLAPFAAPQVVLRDPQPRMLRVGGAP